jgi:hypothetical protein
LNLKLPQRYSAGYLVNFVSKSHFYQKTEQVPLIRFSFTPTPLHTAPPPPTQIPSVQTEQTDEGDPWHYKNEGQGFAE